VELKEADLVLSAARRCWISGGDKGMRRCCHLLRMAVAHGIEDAAAREQRKKPARAGAVECVVGGESDS